MCKIVSGDGALSFPLSPHSKTGVTTTPPTSTTKDPSTSGSANYITIITVTTIFAMLAFFVFVILCVSVRCIARQKRRRQRFHFPPTSKAGSSPPPRSDNSSIYSGMSSLGTESTNFNCGSPHPDPFEKRAVFHPDRSTHISNPPPSLITTARRQSQVGVRVWRFYIFLTLSTPCVSAPWKLLRL